MIGRRGNDEAQSFEEALNGRAPRDAQVADLVRFAESLCEAAAVEPTADFRSTLRAQLMTEAATVLVVTPKAARTAHAARVPQTRPVRRRLASLTAALVASAGVVTVVASSASAVPGEMLYPVKRGMENVELALHRDDASRGEFQLARASERLSEANSLASGDDEAQRRVAGLLDDFTATAADAWTSMDTAYREDAASTAMEDVNSFAESAAGDLTELKAALPDDAALSFTDATDVVAKMTSGVAQRCPTCAKVDLGNLVSAVTDIAKSTPAKEPVKRSDQRGDKGKGATDAGKPATSGSGSGSTGSTATPKPIVVVPTVPTTKAPSLSDVTDPVLGAILGNDDQEGLVPGLLNGLLGTK